MKVSDAYAAPPETVSPPNPVRRKRGSGFNLVELVIVVAVIAILIGLLLPAVM